MGVLAALRSLSAGTQCIGVMITASHNPEHDNGIKLVDFDGGMLSQSWEPYAELLANCSDFSFSEELAKVAAAENIDIARRTDAVVVIGRDTRPHSLELSNCVRQGVEAFGGTVHDLGEIATPQLHFILQKMNKNATAFPVKTANIGELLKDYYHSMSCGYIALQSTVECLPHNSPSPYSIVIDASCGVGSLVVDSFIEYHAENVVDGIDGSGSRLAIDLRNKAGSGPVNEGCGAELVQKNQVPPKNMTAQDRGKLLCSYDGDADRIVFHAFIDAAGSTDAVEASIFARWILIDGDKIATLIASLLAKEVKAAGLDQNFTFGVVQTAYANGAAARYLNAQGISTHIAKTGVKFVHHKALEFDIGIYFEANGHGTVVFSEAFIQEVRGQVTSLPTSAGDTRATALRRLQYSIDLINQAVGDALSDMLYCLACLQVLDMDLYGWSALYTDLPSTQKKIAVPDKSAITCSEDETRILTPEVLQKDLSAAMLTVTQGRCFVRPSGTEDVVRIYAEAATKGEADALAALCQQAIERHLYKT